MNEIEKAIDILRNMAEDCEDCKYYEECNDNNICRDAQDHVFEFALQAQAERDRMRCENCKVRKSSDCPMTVQENNYSYCSNDDFCSRFEPKENENG